MWTQGVIACFGIKNSYKAYEGAAKGCSINTATLLAIGLKLLVQDELACL